MIKRGRIGQLCPSSCAGLRVTLLLSGFVPTIMLACLLQGSDEYWSLDSRHPFYEKWYETEASVSFVHGLYSRFEDIDNLAALDENVSALRFGEQSLPMSPVGLKLDGENFASHRMLTFLRAWLSHCFLLRYPW